MSLSNRRAMLGSGLKGIPNNKIWYTSIDGNIVEPYEDAFGEGNSLLNNTYSNGRGVITFKNDVTIIDELAFRDCRSLTSVTIPDSVTTIERDAFRDCGNLTSVTIGNSVTTIGDGAFGGCESLASVTIPDSVTTIGYNAFQYCRSLQEFRGKFASEDGRCLIIDGTLNAFAPAGLTNYAIPDSVTTIGQYAFYDCNKLTSITIPDSVTTIGNYAFCYCRSLTSITIPDSVTTIGQYAFHSCAGVLIINSKHIIESDNYTSNNYPSINGWLRYANFEEIIIGENIEKIGKYTFAYCKYAKKISISCNQITSIGQNAFFGCEGELVVNCNIPLSSSAAKGAFYKGNFSSITIGDSVTSIGKYAFNTCTSQYLYINYNILQLTTYSDSPFYGSIFSEVIFGDNVSTIGDYAFCNCTSITSITIPDGEIELRIGSNAFYGCKSLTEVNLGNKVSEIGNWAFCDCDNLESITIPNNVETIGQSAFNNCDLLTNVIFNDGVSNIGSSAFTGCNNLKNITFNKDVNITKFLEDDESNVLESALNVEKIYINCNIPANITQDRDNKLCGIDLSKVELHIGENANYNDNGYLNTIGKGAFKDCTIKKIVLYNIRAPYTTANNTQKLGIDFNAFYNCNSELEVKCNIYSGYIGSSTSVGYFGYFAYSGFTKVNISERDSSLGAPISIIGDFAFYNSNSISEVNILVDTISSIGRDAFYNCDSLTSVTIGDGVTTIGDNAFESCDSLTSVTIPDSVTTIGASAFYSCDSLASVTIGDGVTTIGEAAFGYCSSLTSVTIPDSVTTIEDGAFRVCSSLQEFNGKFTSEDGRCLIIDGVLNSFAPAGLTEYAIPDSVTMIGNSAFHGCSSLTSVTIPDSVAEIGEWVFSYCSSLTSVTIGNSVTTIGNSAFYDCSNLTSITIPDSVTEIGGRTFYNCRSLTSITIPDSVTTIGSDPFYNCIVIRNVYYKGTIDKWVSIDFNDRSSNPLRYGNSKLFTYYSNTNNTLTEISKLVTSISGQPKSGDLLIDMSNNTNKEIKKYAFCGAYTSEENSVLIDSIIIKGATSIGEEAFSGMGMKNIVIDDACQTIGEKAFFDCININNIQIGGSASCSLNKIGDNAFATTDVTIEADGVENYLRKFTIFKSRGITITSVQNIFNNRFKNTGASFTIYCYSNDNQTVGVWSNTGYESLWYVQKKTTADLRNFYGFTHNSWTDIGTDYDIY